MSRLRTNIITNRMANGAPTVSNGLVISGVTTTSEVNVGAGVTLNVYGGATYSGIITCPNVSVASSVTATTYYGSGANLTGIDATKIITGNTQVQTIDTGSDGHVKVITEGSERLRINSDGKVGLGTTGSEYGLSIREADNNNKWLMLQKNSGQELLQIREDGDNHVIIDGSHASGELHFYTAGSERLRITSAGNVGIGTDNPQVKLTVSSTSPAVCDIHHIDGGTNDEARIILGALAGNPPSNRGAGIAAVNNGAGHDLIIKCSTTHGLGPTEKFRATSSGKFGFGTNSPDQTVHIHKGSAGSIDSSTASVLTLENNTTAVLQFLTPNNVSAQLRFGDPEDNGAGFIDYSHSSKTMSFGVYGPKRMKLDANEHLGINVER